MKNAVIFPNHLNRGLVRQPLYFYIAQLIFVF